MLCERISLKNTVKIFHLLGQGGECLKSCFGSNKSSNGLKLSFKIFSSDGTLISCKETWVTVH